MRGFTWQRISVREIRITNPEREMRIFLGYAFFFIFVSFCTGLLIRAYPLPILGADSFTNDFWYAALFKITFLLTLPYAIYRKLGYRLRDLPASFDWSFRTVCVLILSFLAGNILNLGHLDWIGEVLPQHESQDVALRIGFATVLPFLTAGFPEELVYRGILQTRIEAVWGRIPAILTANTLFTAWHIPTRYLLAQGIEGQAGNLTSVLMGTGIPVFIVGLIFCLVWDRYRRFWPLVAAHWGVDFLPAVSSLFGIPR